MLISLIRSQYSNKPIYSQGNIEIEINSKSKIIWFSYKFETYYFTILNFV